MASETEHTFERVENNCKESEKICEIISKAAMKIWRSMQLLVMSIYICIYMYVFYNWKYSNILEKLKYNSSSTLICKMSDVPHLPGDCWRSHEEQRGGEGEGGGGTLCLLPGWFMDTADGKM